MWRRWVMRGSLQQFFWLAHEILRHKVERKKKMFWKWCHIFIAIHLDSWNDLNMNEKTYLRPFYINFVHQLESNKWILYFKKISDVFQFWFVNFFFFWFKFTRITTICFYLEHTIHKHMYLLLLKLPHTNTLDQIHNAHILESNFRQDRIAQIEFDNNRNRIRWLWKLPNRTIV